MQYRSHALSIGFMFVAACAPGTGSPALKPAPTTMAAIPTTDPTTNPKYTVPYRVPKPEQIKATMEHLRQRLDAWAPVLAEPATASANSANATPDLSRSHGKTLGLISYPLGVVYTGMLAAYEATGDKAFADFDAKRFQYIADNLPKYTNEKNDKRNPYRNLLHPNSLDACGAINASFVKARRANIGPDLKLSIDIAVNWVSNKQFRLPDGTLARNRPFKNSLWGDDMYMGPSLLAQMGALTGDQKYFDDAARQIVQMADRLFVPSMGLFTHGWNAETDGNQPKYYWGRANGWNIVAMAELLSVLPEDHPQREAILKIFRAHAQGLAGLQSGTGLWHQMLDRPDTFLETSCTAMYTYAIARGVNRGWLSAEAYAPVAIAGWNGITTKITPDGHLSDVCPGTSYAADYIYYYHRPAVDDIHGYGPVLLAGSEVIQLLKNEKYRIESGPNQPIMFVDKKTPPTTRE